VTENVRRQAEALFLEVVDLSPTERPAFFEAQGVSDPALRAEVESLLACLENARITSLGAVETAAGPKRRRLAKDVLP